MQFNTAYKFSSSIALASLMLLVVGGFPGLASAQGDSSAQRESSAQDRAELERTQGEQATEFDRARREQAAEREQASGRLAAAREGAGDELAAARAQLEAAAREVARLSAEVTAPVVEELRRRWPGWTGQRALLGINVEDAERGVRVSGVSPGGPAEASGIRTGDVILSIDGHELAGDASRSPTRKLIEQLSAVRPGDRVSLKILRDGRQRDVSVRPREVGRNGFGFRAPFEEGGPSRSVPFAVPPFGPWRDMELVSLTPDLGAYFGTQEGVLVIRAPRDDFLQLRDGDVILKIGDRMPTSPEHAMRILASFEPGETVQLTIMRRQMQQTLSVQFPAGLPGRGPGVRRGPPEFRGGPGGVRRGPPNLRRPAPRPEGGPARGPESRPDQGGGPPAPGRPSGSQPSGSQPSGSQPSGSPPAASPPSESPPAASQPSERPPSESRPSDNQADDGGYASSSSLSSNA